MLAEFTFGTIQQEELRMKMRMSDREASCRHENE